MRTNEEHEHIHGIYVVFTMGIFMIGITRRECLESSNDDMSQQWGPFHHKQA